jgi:hypothetical protein
LIARGRGGSNDFFDSFWLESQIFQFLSIGLDWLKSADAKVLAPALFIGALHFSHWPPPISQ